MSSHEHYPSDNNSSAPEQVPHSGVHGYEQPPSRQFDKTSLGEAHEQGLLQTPDSPAPIAPSAPERSGNGRKIAAIGAVLGVLAAGAGIFTATRGGESAPNPDAKEPSKSAPANPETVAIDGIQGKATPEQVSFVIDNPVTTADYPTAAEQVAAFGERWNVIYNSGEIDWKNTSGEPNVPAIYTAETDQQLTQMLDSVLETTNDTYYDELMTSIRKLKDQHLAMFEASPSSKVWQTWEATGEAIPADEQPNTSIINVNILHDSNKPDDFTSDGEYNDDINADLTLRTDKSGVVKIVSINNVTDIDNIG